MHSLEVDPVVAEDPIIEDSRPPTFEENSRLQKASSAACLAIKDTLMKAEKGYEFTLPEGTPFTEFHTKKDRKIAYHRIVSAGLDKPQVDRTVDNYLLPQEEIARAAQRDPLRYYIESNNRYRVLDKEEEQALFANIEVGLQEILRSQEAQHSADEGVLLKSAAAYQVVYHCNIRLVISQVLRMKTGQWSGLRPDQLPELMQYGMEGLHDVIQKFDYTRGYKFSTFARDALRSPIERAAMEKLRIVKLPTHAHRQYTQILKAEEKLRSRLERDPDIAEIAAVVNLEPDLIVALRRAGPFDMTSLNSHPLTNEDAEIIELLPDDGTPAADVIAQRSEATRYINQILDTVNFSPRERLVLSLSFGLVRPEIKSAGPLGKEALLNRGISHEKIGSFIGVTPTRVGQIARTAMKKIRVKHPELIEYAA